MNFKIIETSVNQPDVLVYRDRNDDGEEQVIIHAFGKIDESDDMIISEVVEFENPETAMNFVKDYSAHSANEFCKRNNLKY